MRLELEVDAGVPAVECEGRARCDSEGRFVAVTVAASAPAQFARGAVVRSGGRSFRVLDAVDPDGRGDVRELRFALPEPAEPELEPATLGELGADPLAEPEPEPAAPPASDGAGKGRRR